MTSSPWRQLFAEVERVYVDVAKVLHEADGLMDQAGYARPDGENSVGREISASPSKPSWWFPGWVARFYHPHGAPPPKPVLYVVVFLHARVGDDFRAFDEPVIAGGVWRFNEPRGAWYPWMAKAWAWGSRFPADGTVTSKHHRGNGIDAKGRCFGVPLASIVDPESLKALVVDPLIRLSAEAW